MRSGQLVAVSNHPVRMMPPLAVAVTVASVTSADPDHFKDGAMTSGENAGVRFQVNPGLLATGAALAGIGSLLGLAGLTVSCVALADATRRWVNARGVPPGELARAQWARARAATVAGASAWRDGSAPAAAHR